MIRRRRAADGGDHDDAPADSPWATGDIEITAAPTEFDWAAAGVNARGDDIEATPAAGDSPAGPDGRTRILVLVGVLVAVALTAAVVLWPRDDEGDADPVGDDVPTTVDRATETTEPDTSTSELPDDTDPDTSGPVDPVTGEPTLLDAAGDLEEGRPNRIDLPPALDGVAVPTEVVIASRLGVATLSIPSGRVRWSTSEVDTVGGDLVVAPDAAAYVTSGPSGASRLLVVPRTGPPVEVDLDRADGGYVRGWVDTADGTAFQVQSFSSGSEQLTLVSLSGETTEIDGAQSSSGFSTFDYARTTELNIVNDAGGVYLLGPDGTGTRIATGRAFAANGDHLLVRECDATLSCRLIVQNYVTGETTEVDPSLEVASVFGLDLSPDGTAITSVSPGDLDGGDLVRIVDLATGDVVESGRPGPAFFTPGSLWLADSSGVLQTTPDWGALSFIDRTTGENIEFGESFDRIFALGVRYPDEELPPDSGELVEATIELTGELGSATRLDLAVLGAHGTMARVDLDDRTAVAWPVPDLDGSSRVQLVHLRDMVTAINERDGFVSTVGDAASIDADVLDRLGTPALPGPGQGLVWSPTDEAADDAVDHELVSIDPAAAPGGTELVLPDATLLGGDGRGGLAVTLPGAAYSVTSTTNRLTTGSVLALGSAHVLARECDDTLVCRTLLLDRDTGERSAVVPPRNVGEAVRADTEAIPPGDHAPVGGTLSPDGTIALTRVAETESGEGWVLNDLASGTWQEIPAPADLQPLVWSDDGAALAYLSDAGLFVYERSTGQLLRVIGLGDVAAIVRVTDEFASPPD